MGRRRIGAKHAEQHHQHTGASKILMRLGANVVHKGNAMVHVSGHASEGELLYCYNIVEPEFVMPVHGETRHLIANGRIAEKTGVPAETIAAVAEEIGKAGHAFAGHVWRSAAAASSATVFRTVSPAACPKESLIDLNQSMSRRMSAA